MRTYRVKAKLVSYWIKRPWMGETRGYTVKTIQFCIRARTDAHARRKIEWRRRRSPRLYDNCVMKSAQIFRTSMVRI